MKINKNILTLFSTIGLMVSLNSAVQAESPLPPSSLPLDNVFAIPKGANSYVDGNIVVITKNIKSQIGSIFSTEANKLDLTNSFHAEMYVYFGDKKSNAADGMTFVMHADKAATENFSGGLGDQLGVYAKFGEGKDGLKEQIKKSFVVEFDTYHNGNSFDKGIAYNSGKGHIAYSFPDIKSAYNFDENGNVSANVHNGLYYPTDYLSNNTWHLFSVDWNADSNMLSYNFDDAPTVIVPINPSVVFGTNSVYWGFTGSTGSSYQESKVSFKQIPGLVDISSKTEITSKGLDITETGISGTEGDVKFNYSLKYNGGKQNLLSPIFNLNIDELLSFKPGTLTIDGINVSDNYFVDGRLNYSFPNDLSTTKDSFSLSFEATPKIVTDQDTQTTINYSMNAKNYSGNNIKSVFPIKKVNIIKREDFENQSWLINEINRQLSPKKIDVDVYEEDLNKIKSINITLGTSYSNEHIPSTINKLTNLKVLQLLNLQLVGKLPIELGDLNKLEMLSISGNTFDGGIPSSLGKLPNIETLSLNNNNLKGSVPISLGLLSNLKKLNINDNLLSGQLPDFSMNMDQITLNNTQITYNLDTVPSFLTNIEGNNYSNTFIDGLNLSGNPKITSENNQIKPFNKSDSGYFNLQATIENINKDLYDEHVYTIKNTVNGTIYYNGKKDEQATIPYEKGISYTVILDGADKNPNNMFIILGKERELKFGETPVSLLLNIKIGTKNQFIIPKGNLTIFDDRENKSWKLNVRFSELTQNQIKLQGEYSYKNKDGVSQTIATDQNFLLETGESNSINEVIQVSNSWGTEYGLRYTAYNSNLIGNYQGEAIWTLEDAP